MLKIVSICLLVVSLAIAENKMEYEISFVGMSMDYSEYDDNGAILDSENSHISDIIGAEFKYRYFFNNASSIDFEIITLSGYTDYIGSAIDTKTSYGSLKSSSYNEIRDISLSYKLHNASSFHGIGFIGGIGIGYRFWRRELSSIQIEDYKWYSLRILAGLQYKYKDISSNFELEYQYGINPVMSASGFSQDFELSSATIVKLSIPIRYVINKNFDLVCAYVFEYQKIDESNTIYDTFNNGYVEPDSKAYNQYMKLGIVFKY